MNVHTEYPSPDELRDAFTKLAYSSSKFSVLGWYALDCLKDSRRLDTMERTVGFIERGRNMGGGVQWHARQAPTPNDECKRDENGRTGLRFLLDFIAEEFTDDNTERAA